MVQRSMYSSLLMVQDEEGCVSLEELTNRQTSASVAGLKGGLDRTMTDDLGLEVSTWHLPMCTLAARTLLPMVPPQGAALTSGAACCYCSLLVACCAMFSPHGPIPSAC
jgi:hypothetical protein